MSIPNTKNTRTSEGNPNTPKSLLRLKAFQLRCDAAHLQAALGRAPWASPRQGAFPALRSEPHRQGPRRCSRRGVAAPHSPSHAVFPAHAAWPCFPLALGTLHSRELKTRLSVLPFRWQGLVREPWAPFTLLLKSLACPFPCRLPPPSPTGGFAPRIAVRALLTGPSMNVPRWRATLSLQPLVPRPFAFATGLTSSPRSLGLDSGGFLPDSKNIPCPLLYIITLKLVIHAPLLAEGN